MARNKDDRAQRPRRHRVFIIGAAFVVALSGCQGAAQSQPAAAAPEAPRAAAAPVAAQASRATPVSPPPLFGSRKYRACVTASLGDAPAQSRCLDDELAYQRRALDQLYQERTAAVVGVQRSVLQAQRAAWLKENERLCSTGQGSAAATGAVDRVCELRRTIARFDALADDASAVPQGLGVRGTPDLKGNLRLRLFDTTLSLQSDGCSGQRALVCTNATVQLSAPALGEQTLSLAQVVFAPKVQSGTTAYSGSLASGFVEGWHSFMLSDINADGHEDLLVWTGFDGAYGDPSYTYYLYDAGSKRLVENRALAELVRGHSLSRIADGRLYVWYRSGACERGEKTIDAREAAPKIVERKDYNTCQQDKP